MGQPDWKDNVARLYDESRHTATRRPGKTVFGRELRPLQLTATRLFVRYVDKAAAKRGVNRSTYIRRICAIAAAADLGIPVRVILHESPRPDGFKAERLRTGALAGARDDGTGIEDWCPHPGCDGAHLRPNA